MRGITGGRGVAPDEVRVTFQDSNMRIVKKINNNVALARDEHGHEMVVFGSGIGFHAVPYELEDQSRITRVFHDVDQGLLAAVASISDDVLAASLDIVDIAAAEIDRKLNSNLAFTLGDHLQFAIERLQEGIALESPLSLEVQLVYPNESAIAREALGVVARHTGVTLPESEASAIALHIVNAETGGAQDPANFALIAHSAGIIDGCIGSLEDRLGISVDRTSYPYLRFVTHVRYLIKRLSSNDGATSKNVEMFAPIAESFPTAASGAQAIAEHLSNTHGWQCSDEEQLYLIMYINRLLPPQTH